LDALAFQWWNEFERKKCFACRVLNVLCNFHVYRCEDRGEGARS
jgi:hypothetical protein